MEIDPASEIEVSIPAEVRYWLDENRSNSLVVLKAEENLLNMIDVKSDNGALTIRSESCLNSKEGIRIDIITPRLEEVVLNGNASFFGENKVTTEEMNLIVKGAGRIELNLKAKDLDCEISGTGEIILNGTTEELDIKINGTANVEALKLAAQSVDIKVNGAGDIRVYAQEKLKVKINGAGNVQYKGKPTDIQQKINGAGAVSKQKMRKTLRYSSL